MKKIGSRRSRAVAPVLATLLMIAVAVAMSVIIFMWSQGFLSQTSESVGSQQGAQNQAAQSSIAIESTTFTIGSSKDNITIIVRNVGTVAVTLGSLSITGISSNAGFTGSLISTVSSGSLQTPTASDGSSWTVSSTGGSLSSIAKGESRTIKLTGPATAGSQTDITSGDVITVKVTTDRGTFAQASYTVP